MGVLGPHSAGGGQIWGNCGNSLHKCSKPQFLSPAKKGGKGRKGGEREERGGKGRKGAPPKCFHSQEERKSAKISEKSNLAPFVPFSLSPLIRLFPRNHMDQGGRRIEKMPSSRYRCEALISQLRALLRNTVVASAIASDAASTSSSFERVHSQALLAMLKKGRKGEGKNGRKGGKGRREVVEKFAPSLESLSSLGLEGMNLGCPRHFAGMRPLGASRPGSQKKLEKESKMTIFQVFFGFFRSFSTLFRASGSRGPGNPFSDFFPGFLGRGHFDPCRRPTMSQC